MLSPFQVGIIRHAQGCSMWYKMVHQLYCKNKLRSEVDFFSCGQASSPCEKTFKMMIVSSEVFVVSISNGDFFNVLNRENLEYTYFYFKWNSNFSFWYVRFCNYKCTLCKYKEFIKKLQSSFRCFEIERTKEK